MLSTYVNTVGILNAVALGGEIGKRAVENNYLSVLSQKTISINLNKKLILLVLVIL
ncbi:VENN motif pre-toxin domain-containing protein [Avibacterium paragallinarum]|uniref:VENN motif pre-toxin domain-containing protein n=1 Tax=Avibacterium paragallinarum TaxID=728 RepID=UPI00384BC10B